MLYFREKRESPAEQIRMYGDSDDWVHPHFPCEDITSAF